MLNRIAIALVLSLTAARAQPAAPLPIVNAPNPGQPALSAPQLRALLAPVALYPDTVLANMLTAATYPAQIVEAARFLADPAQAGQSVAQLTAAAAGHDWDPGVVALLAFPQVLQMMDADLEWTEHLGRAFIAQQTDVLDAIQSLRQLAQQAGGLASGPNDSVVNDGSDITISAPSPQEVYLPVYNPGCVFGPAGACAADAGQVTWLAGVALPYTYVPWSRLDWRHRYVGYGAGRSEEPVFRPGAHVHVFSYAPAASRPPYAARSVLRPVAPVPRVVFRAPAMVVRAPVVVAHVGVGSRR